MTTEQLEDIEQLASRAVACKHWRWMPGMVTTTGVRILRRDDDGYTTGYGPRTSYCVMQVFPDALPDLRDPATMGCLLALVREAWKVPTVTTARTHPFSGSRPWVVGISMRAFYGQTEASALVAALEAAP